VSGSVGLGAAMRAACNSLGKDIAELEAVFCQPDSDNAMTPQVDPEVYEIAAKEFERVLVEMISVNS